MSAWTAASRAFGFTARNAGKSGSELGNDWPQLTIPILQLNYRPLLRAVNRRTHTFQGERAGPLKAWAAIGAVSTRLDVQTPAMATPDFHYFPRVD